MKKPYVELLACTETPMRLLENIAGVCYQKKANESTLKHILKAGHWSVFEHCMATFRIYMSITTLLQITRHRHLSFTVQSSRGSQLKGTYQTGNEIVDKFNNKSMLLYSEEVSKGSAPLEILAYCLPKSAMYEVIVSGNFRAWMEYLPKRLCMRASKEHRAIAQEIKKILAEKVCPLCFENVKAPCEVCKEARCEFTHENN
jgi:thymidylate synthase (FAD)